MTFGQAYINAMGAFSFVGVPACIVLSVLGVQQALSVAPLLLVGLIPWIATRPAE
jgi:hypothetical protein